MSETHVVTNQVPPLTDYNPATSPVLIEAMIREGGGWGLDEVIAGVNNGIRPHVANLPCITDVVRLLEKCNSWLCPTPMSSPTRFRH